MENYFDSEIKNIEREIVNLTTSMQKSAIVAPTVVQTVQVTRSLQSGGSDKAFYNARFRVTTNTRALVMATLDSYFDDITLNDRVWVPDTRSAWLYVSKISRTVYYVNISFRGKDGDNTTISGGGSVQMTRTLTVRCTDEFTLEELL